MITIFGYVVLYYNINQMFQNLYLPHVIKYVNVPQETLASNPELYFLLKITSYFMLLLYGYDIIYRTFYIKMQDKNSIGLSFVYINHILNIIIKPNMKIIEYELERVVMWTFTTPLMLKMLSDENELSLIDLKIHYHIMAILPHTFCVPFKNTPIYLFSSILLSIPGILFINSLYKYKSLQFTNLYILIWGIFMFINLIDITGLISPDIIHAFYNLADTIFKFTFNFVISSYNEQELTIRDNMDLQSVNFVSKMIKCIKQFEYDNQKLTAFSSELVQYFKKKFVNKIPKTNSKLKLELLRKILPFDMDRNYMELNEDNSESTGTSAAKKEFTFICVMFMDIVNYTELASRYSDSDIFKLLDKIYSHYDNIIKKYSLLQKIETIGDAYMVVGDIFREKLNHKAVVKEIILLGLEFIKEIKNIKTPDDIPLRIRIGINMGKVSIGILGNEIPRLCVVGNTVNVTARLQSTADPDTIQMSRHVYEQAQEIDFGMDIEYIAKENVFLKNIGSITTYNITPPPPTAKYS